MKRNRNHLFNTTRSTYRRVRSVHGLVVLGLVKVPPEMRGKSGSQRGPHELRDVVLRDRRRSRRRRPRLRRERLLELLRPELLRVSRDAVVADRQPASIDGEGEDSATSALRNRQARVGTRLRRALGRGPRGRAARRTHVISLYSASEICLHSRVVSGRDMAVSDAEPRGT